MNPQTLQLADVQEAQVLAGPEFGVEWTETARSYLPLFEHLPLSQPQKVQLIADLLTVIDHVFDACLNEAAEGAQTPIPKPPTARPFSASPY